MPTSPPRPPKVSLRTRSWNRIRKWAQLRDPSKDLGSILEHAAGSDSMADKILWLSRLVGWIRGSGLSIQTGPTRSSHVRLKFLIQLLQRQPHWRGELSEVLFSVLAGTDATSLFAQTELTEQGGLFSELIRRAAGRLAPLAPRPTELVYVADFVFTDIDDAEWIESLPSDLWEQLLNELGWGSSASSDARAALNQSLIQAVEQLTIQATALGVTPEIRHRSTDAASLFMNLSRLALAPLPDIKAVNTALDDCREALALVYKRIETTGVSLQLLYRLETISGLINRASLILFVIDPNEGMRERSLRARDFIAEVVRARKDRQSVRRLLRMNFDIFSRKLIQHAGETGEHYITRSRKEYWGMLWSGGKGGWIMVPTTYLKFIIASLHLPLFFEGFFLGSNYAGSFLAMHFTGSSLATKQPAMTAAALAERLSVQMDREKLAEFAQEVIRISRSQFIAAVGNVGFVVPPAALVAYLFTFIFKRTPLTPEYALHTLESFNPITSPALMYASIAGVLLWLSSLCAGWLQNWVIYREIPESIAQNRRLNEVLGAHRSRRLGEWVARNATGVGGNVSIGFMLAFAPIVGNIFGLPIDIRHVTISSAQAAVAFVSMKSELITWPLVASTCIGIILIGAFNFGVSMALALFVAVRAKRVRGVWVRVLLRHVGRLFILQPLTFLLPPGRDEIAPAVPHDEH